MIIYQPTISGSLVVTGSVIATDFTGSLLGTATTASYVLQAVSSSFATTASYVLNAGSSATSLLAYTGSWGTVSSGATNTISYSLPFSTSGLAVGDVITLNSRVKITSSVGNKYTRLYINTASSLTGAVLIGQALLASTTVSTMMARQLVIKVLNGTGDMTSVINPTSTTLVSDFTFGGNIALTSASIDWTQPTLYAILALQGNSGDAFQGEFMRITKNSL